MTRTLLTNIGQLVTNEPREIVANRPQSVGGTEPLGIIDDAAMVIDDATVLWVGTAEAAEVSGGHDIDEVIDCGGRSVIPGFVDSHTHLVFAGDRSDEFEARMTGRAYSAGGISLTVDATRKASPETLRVLLRNRINEMHRQGTTTVEIKGGYHLTAEGEGLSAKLAREVTDEVTFLGAHVVPSEFADARNEYLDLVCGEMLGAVADSARWVDVFCDEGAFTVLEARRVLEAGVGRGLKPRMHAAQLAPNSQAIALAVELGCASIDHATHLSDEDIATLAASSCVVTLLPGAEFSTRSPYPNARRLLDAGVTLAIATNCNPGSSYTSSMAFCIAVAVREMGMSVAEALWSATAGGATALHRRDVGKLTPGSRADIVELDAPSYVHLAYRPGTPLTRRTWKDGVVVSP